MSKKNKDPNIYLLDILLQIQQILKYTADGARDDKTYDAVRYCLAVIGEAARRIPLALKKQHDYIPWAEINGLRNVLVHEYEDVIEATIWRIVEDHLPLLRSHIESVIKRLEN